MNYSRNDGRPSDFSLYKYSVNLAWNVSFVDSLLLPVDQFFVFIFSPATGWLPPGAALSVHWLAGLQGHASVETIHPPVGQEVG